jgi:hypothetical protein
VTATALQEREFERRLGRPLISAADFARRVGEALADGRGFAAGKVANTERAMLQYRMVREREADRLRIWAFERMLTAQALLTAGIFPPDAAFHRRFETGYAEAVRSLDCVGVDPRFLPSSLEVLGFHEVEGDVMRWWDQEPDHRSAGDDWLGHLRGRRLLLVSPFASLLARRATRETFEAVWASIGKPWFAPAHVDALEFPFGWSPSTWKRFPTALDLLEDIASRVAGRDFDVAIVGAGGLGIPIAAFVKGLGRVGISLGGFVQPLFGIAGERWRGYEDWQRAGIFNDAWIELPPEYHPGPGETLEDYW